MRPRPGPPKATSGVEEVEARSIPNRERLEIEQQSVQAKAPSSQLDALLARKEAEVNALNSQHERTLARVSAGKGRAIGNLRKERDALIREKKAIGADYKRRLNGAHRGKQPACRRAAGGQRAEGR